jgi:hypothetical protein
MKFDVPDEFVKILEEIGMEVQPKQIIRVLEWASNNHEEAKRIAEECEGFNASGRREFALSIQLNYDPAYAMECARKRNSEVRKRRSLVSKMISSIKKSGAFEFTLSNGVTCRVQKSSDDGCYWFHYNVQGETISVRHLPGHISRTLEFIIEDLEVLTSAMEAVYRGVRYNGFSNGFFTLLNAVRDNLKPEVEALLGVEE